MTLIRSLTPAVALTLALTLAGCASMGHIEPQARLLDANQLGAGHAIGGANAPLNWPTEQWWKALNDTQLNRLLDTAMAASPNLHVAAARVRHAEAVAGRAEEKLDPDLVAKVQVNRERYPLNGTTPPPANGTWQWRSEAMLAGSYDLDLWGRNRAGLAAAVDEVHMASAEAQMARLTLETAIVRAYIQLSYEFELQDLIKASLTQRERVLEVTKRRQRAGLATDVDVTLIETTLPASRRNLEQSDESITLLRNQLAALMGQGPAAGEGIARPSMKMELVPGLPSALPAELVGRRPDIAAQRWRIEAAAQTIKMAKANFYPNINLLAYAGLNAFELKNFLRADAREFGVAPAVSLPLFNGGSLRAELGQQTALYDVAVEQYNGTVINALSDVANAITKVRSLQQQSLLTKQSLASAQKAQRLANSAFQAGMTDSINVLNARIALLSEEQQMAQIGARELDGYVTLMAALGGGVEQDLPPATASASAGPAASASASK
jgi:NodT family efflux transporter outer membrane factor (OMF) lipoprotein